MSSATPMDSSPVQATFLDIPSANAQLRRKELIVERLLKNPPPPSTCRLPASQILSRVQEFLPKLKESNDKLTELITTKGEEVQIDCTTDESKPYIEMNLATFVHSDDSEEER